MTNKAPLESWEADSTSALAWRIDLAHPERFWCFYDGFSLRAKKTFGASVGMGYDLLELALFNPLGSTLEIMTFDYASFAKRNIPIEMGHCLIEAFASDGDWSFYGNLHALLENGETLELPTGAQLRKINALTCYLISRRNDREDIMTMFDKQMGYRHG